MQSNLFAWRPVSPDTPEQIVQEFSPTIVHVPELSMAASNAPRCDLIEGENLSVLKALERTWAKRLTAIYIDPPYNTGSMGFAYRDRSEGRGQAARHESWTEFMRERLTVARKLLIEDGVIYISIDDNEQARLRILCDDVFGEDNFVAQFIWHKTKKGKALSRLARQVTEYVMCYAKDRDAMCKRGLYGSAADAELANPFFHRPNAPRDVTFPANIIETNWADGDYEAGVFGDPADTLSVRILEPFKITNGRISTPLVMHGRFRWQQSTLDEEIEAGVRFSVRQGKFRIVFYRSDGHKAPLSLLDDRCGVGTYEEASAEVEDVLGYRPFIYPKPVRLVKYLMQAATWNRPDAVVMDFFAGTGTTGHAVAALNGEDGGNRRCILITDNSGKIEEEFVADAGNSGICRSITRARLEAAFTGRHASGRTAGLPGRLVYYQSIG
jgi:adenine-specific DNA-methyltransferase